MNVVLEALDKISRETPTKSPEDVYLIVSLCRLARAVHDGVSSEQVFADLQVSVNDNEVAMCVVTPEGPAQIPFLLAEILVAVGLGDDLHVCDLRKAKQLIQSN